MSNRVYGFRSCDTVRTAMKWLAATNVAFDFIDYRRDELDPSVIDDWFARAGWEAVFNRNSTAFRELPDNAKVGLDAPRAKQLMLANTNLIKRPVLDTGDTLRFGFKADTWARALGK